MAKEFVILVDRDDNPTGLEEKVKCHLPDGLLHRAFTALLFTGKKELVLTRRAGEKMLWPGDWDGTFASHPREGETYVSSAQRRMPEELGITGSLDYACKFEYHVPYKDVGSENEVCGTLVGITKDPGQLKEIKGEIDEIKIVATKQLLSDIQTDPRAYCPWMLIALELLDRSPMMHAKYKDVLSDWTGGQVHGILLDAIKEHLPDGRWRFINEGK